MPESKSGALTNLATPQQSLASVRLDSERDADYSEDWSEKKESPTPTDVWIGVKERLLKTRKLLAGEGRAGKAYDDQALAEETKPNEVGESIQRGALC